MVNIGNFEVSRNWMGRIKKTLVSIALSDFCLECICPFWAIISLMSTFPLAIIRASHFGFCLGRMGLAIKVIFASTMRGTHFLFCNVTNGGPRLGLLLHFRPCFFWMGSTLIPRRLPHAGYRHLFLRFLTMRSTSKRSRLPPHHALKYWTISKCLAYLFPKVGRLGFPLSGTTNSPFVGIGEFLPKMGLSKFFFCFNREMLPKIVSGLSLISLGYFSAGLFAVRFPKEWILVAQKRITDFLFGLIGNGFSKMGLRHILKHLWSPNPSSIRLGNGKAKFFGNLLSLFRHYFPPTKNSPTSAVSVAWAESENGRTRELYRKFLNSAQAC